jgi:tetratricopeptide (TPR) repeat protein
VASTVVLVFACVAVVGLRGPGGLPKTSRRSQAVPVLGASSARDDRVPHDPELASKTVAFWQKQAERDPQGALELRELAGAFLARQRETGDIADAVKAEEAARQSLKILPRNNSAALIPLTRSLLAQHRFSEALEVARLAALYDLRAGRVIADVRLELGDYDAAERALAASPPVADDLNYYALRARLEAISGKPDVALRLLRNAQRLADDRPDMPAEAVAWYHTMVGHALIESGRLDEGERACQSALRIFPRAYRAMTGMAEAAAWRGDWHAVIEWGKKAVRCTPQNPVALNLIGNAYTALGHDQEAERHYQLLKELTHSFPRIYDRHWALFCADHGRDLDEALALARKDLELRQDVHGYDTLAWVCFQKGMLPEAESAMQKALAHGTREATLFYHAGMIARASGDPARAKDYFTRAREINPHSIPLRWLQWMNAKDG